jgi:adenine-specific DNA-methyltransferase
MAHIDALIDKVQDPELRQALREQVDTLLAKRSFGLVYQQHKPETVELPNYKIRRGCKVRIRADQDGTLYRVESVSSGSATLISLDEAATHVLVPLADAVVVREFGEVIYPGLKSLGRKYRASGKPPHIVINAENYHALETLLYAYEEKIDAIYIDPPYNTGARDWKYNNDYVDGVDQFRHSKWLAFMERRLLLARRLLKPNGVLIVTIDEHEVDNLGLLLRQVLPDAAIQRVTMVVNPKGNTQTQFSRVDEYAFFCFHGEARVVDGPDSGLGDVANTEPVWTMLMRRGSNSLRNDRPTMFYPIIVSTATETIIGVGPALAPDETRESVRAAVGTRFVWPIRTDRTEGRWQIGRERLIEQLEEGTVKLGARGGIQYVPDKGRQGIKDGSVEVTGKASDGSLRLRWNAKTTRPKTVWFRPSHNAATYGTDLLAALLGERGRFPFPKSVYVVKDALRAAIGNQPDALVLDFFAGSGTTMHAVALLNAEDGGCRQSIMITNNEVSVDEGNKLHSRGLNHGDPEWEELGIFHHVTCPRVEAVITGLTPAGKPVSGEYLGSGLPIADGLEENVEFLELTYEDPDLISLGRKFEAIAPLLWLKAGSRGACIDHAVSSWALPDDANYGILFDVDQWRVAIQPE